MQSVATVYIGDLCIYGQVEHMKKVKEIRFAELDSQ